MRDTLNQNYADKVRQLQDATEATKLQLDQERRNLVISQKQAQEVAAQIERNRQELDRYRNAYDQKMADFYSQKQALESTMAQAQAQANQFSQMEADYKKRVDILRQNIAVQRHRFESQISQLTDQLKKTTANRNMIANSLEKCSAARDSIVQRVNQLTDENMRLKDMFLQQKARMDMMKAQYEAHIEKMRSQAVNIQTDLQNCAQRLQDATLVHDHVKRMKEEAMNLRLNLEEQIRAAKGNEQAMNRLLQDRELEKQQVTKLQAALQECGFQRSKTESGLQMTNEQLRETKRMQTQLTDEIKTISDEYQRALKQREAVMAREQLQQQVKEETLKRETAIAQSRSADSQEQVRRLQKQRQMLSDSLANTEFERARQVQALVDAQNITNPPVRAGPGKSSLVQI
jgi:chromosome segregation ATPase